MRFRLAILSFLLIFLLLPKPLFSAGFQLKTVGALNVEGTTYKHLWYTNNRVTFTGTALQNATVVATINGTSETITADSSGNWSYTANLNQGDNSVSFESDGGTISFTLTIGEVPENVGPIPQAETPTVGIITPTMTFLFLGVLLISSGYFFYKKSLIKS